MVFTNKLCVITHVPHWISGSGDIYAYEPYIREIEVWASLFSKIEICAPRSTGLPSGHQAILNCKNVSWIPFEYNQEVKKFAWLQRLLQIPKMAIVLYHSILRNDLIHLRSPGHPAFIGQLFVRLMGKSSITKWAGFYGPFDGERLTSKLERKLVRHSGSKHIVLVYGDSTKDHEISFLPALMSTMELFQARNMSSQKIWKAPWQVLSIGRITPVKGFDLAIRGLGELFHKEPNIDWQYTLVGDGVDLEKLKALVTDLGISDRVTFTGYLPFSKVQELYAQAHLTIMPGIKEGWPKVIAESWAHGVLPICASAGLVPKILIDPKSGVLFDPDPESLSNELANIMKENIESLYDQSKYIMQLAELYSLEYFRDRLRNVLSEHFPLVVG